MSAECNRRATKRHQTERRLQQCAVGLTLDKGFDGWTMDDLAAAADVSRRTVFNYFDTKADVVLGPLPELDDAKVRAFVAGGPTGRLLDDVLALADDVLIENSDPEVVAASRAAILGDPRLIALVHERFELLSAGFVEHVRSREGESFSAAKARLIGRLVALVFDSAMERVEAGPGRPFHDHFDEALADARDLLS